MSAFLSKMEEKSCESTASYQFPALLHSVQLQFLSGCFALGTQIIGSHTANYETQHYMVHLRRLEVMNMLANPDGDTENCSHASFCSFFPLFSMQCGTHSASLDTQRELQSAAHTFYQQVVRVLKQRVLFERKHPGRFLLTQCCSV